MIGLGNSQKGFARGKLLIIILVAAAVLFAIFAVIFLRPSDTKDDRAVTNPTGYRATGDQFMKALGQNNVDATLKLLTETGKIEVGGEDKWRQTVNDSFSKAKAEAQFMNDYPIDDVGGIYKDKEPKLVTYKMDIFNATWQISLTVVKDQGSWKVDRIGSELQ